MEFNESKPNVIHLDINSCFATLEQQANPLLRDKVVVVGAYTTDSGCILAASVTAKKLGIKTGMKIIDAKRIYPKLITILPDPPKYRYVHKKILKILKNYSLNVISKSIDEFVFKVLDNYDPIAISKEIKRRIKEEIGEYITVSIGISTNRYLAKVASNLQKPNGLSEINSSNYIEIFSKLKLTELTGIKKGNSSRLNLYGIKTVTDFYNAPIWRLKLVFSGICGLYWHTRLHGFEVDDFSSTRKTYGNSYAFPPNKVHLKFEILSKLCEKTGFRLRRDKKIAQGVHFSILFKDGSYWHKGVKTKHPIYDSCDIYKEAKRLAEECLINEIPRVIAVNVFNLQTNNNLQLNILRDEIKKTNLVKAFDLINTKWGLYTIHMAKMSLDSKVVQDRISFGQL